MWRHLAHELTGQSEPVEAQATPSHTHEPPYYMFYSKTKGKSHRSSCRSPWCHQGWEWSLIIVYWNYPKVEPPPSNMSPQRLEVLLSVVQGPSLPLVLALQSSRHLLCDPSRQHLIHPGLGGHHRACSTCFFAPVCIFCQRSVAVSSIHSTALWIGRPDSPCRHLSRCIHIDHIPHRMIAQSFLGHTSPCSRSCAQVDSFSFGILTPVAIRVILQKSFATVQSSKTCLMGSSEAPHVSQLRTHAEPSTKTLWPCPRTWDAPNSTHHQINSLSGNQTSWDGMMSILLHKRRELWTIITSWSGECTATWYPMSESKG
jgi:hypothetical protein